MTGPKGPYKKIRPGVYLDRDGAAVFNAADILADLGWEDTEENRQAVMQVLFELGSEMAEGEQPIGVVFRTPDNHHWRKLK